MRLPRTKSTRQRPSCYHSTRPLLAAGAVTMIAIEEEALIGIAPNDPQAALFGEDFGGAYAALGDSINPAIAQVPGGFEGCDAAATATPPA
jgi:hypothetical protein